MDFYLYWDISSNYSIESDAFLVSKFKEKKAMKIGFFLLSVSFFLLPFSNSVFLLISFLTILSFGNGLFNPTIQALASEQVKKIEYGEVLGIMQSFESIGRIFGPVVAGEFFSISLNLPFYFSFFVLFILFLIINKKL